MKNKPTFTTGKETAMKAISNNIPQELQMIRNEQLKAWDYGIKYGKIFTLLFMAFFLLLLMFFLIV